MILIGTLLCNLLGDAMRLHLQPTCIPWEDNKFLIVAVLYSITAWPKERENLGNLNPINERGAYQARRTPEGGGRLMKGRGERMSA